MNYFITFILLLCPVFATAQKISWEKFDFMLGIKLEMTENQVDSILKLNQPEYKIQKLEQKNNNQPKIYLVEGLYNGLTSKLSLSFLKDSLHEILVNFEGENLNQTKQEFAEIKTIFEKKFNLCENDKANFLQCLFGNKNEYSAIVKVTTLHSKTMIVMIFKRVS